jgi:hypothetical protein
MLSNGSSLLSSCLLEIALEEVATEVVLVDDEDEAAVDDEEEGLDNTLN